MRLSDAIEQQPYNTPVRRLHWHVGIVLTYENGNWMTRGPSGRPTLYDMTPADIIADDWVYPKDA